MSRKLDKARANMEAAELAVTEWQKKTDELGASLAEAEASVGAVVLESGDLEGSTRQVADLREQAEAANSTVAAAEATRDAAKHEVLLAEATDLRAEAQRLDQQAEKHAARTRDLVHALEAHEGGPYVPDNRTPRELGGPGYWIPKSEGLRIQAKAARKKATDLEQRAKRLEGGPRENQARAGRAATAA